MHNLWNPVCYVLRIVGLSKFQIVNGYLFLPPTVKPRPSDLKPRHLTYPILTWAILVLQTYQPGVKSLGLAFALWNILKIVPMLDPVLARLISKSQKLDALHKPLIVKGFLLPDSAQDPE